MGFGQHFFVITALIIFSSVAVAKTDICAIADKVSREFTLDAQNDGLTKAGKFLDSFGHLYTNDQKLPVYFEHQFRRLAGRKVLHSVPSRGPEHEKCSFSDK